MERRGNQYVIIDLLDFNVYDLWKNLKICVTSSVGNFENHRFTRVSTIILSDARIPGLIVPGTSDLAGCGNHFPNRAA